MESVITSVITEPEPAIVHFKSTRKSGFACITLLCLVFIFIVQVPPNLIWDSQIDYFGSVHEKN